jgi:hypothetical protein
MKKQFLWMLILALLCVWVTAGADEPANRADLDKIEKGKLLEQQKLALEKEMQAARQADQAIKEAKLAAELEGSNSEKELRENRAVEEKLSRPQIVVPYEPRLILAQGDDCSDPILLVTIDGNDPGASLPVTDADQTTCGRGNSYTGLCGSSYGGGEEIVYEVVVSNATVNVDITLDPGADNWTGLFVDDACPDDGSCIDYGTNGSGGGTITLSNVSLAPGTYYIMVDTWPTPNCVTSFDLTIDEHVVIPGDICEDPLLITLDVNNEYTDTRDLCPFNNDYRVSGGDVIYVFTPEADLHLVVETCNSPEEFDDYLLLYDDANCGGDYGTEIENGDYGCPSGDHGRIDHEFLNGQTYYIMIDHWEISEPYCGTYTLDIYPYVEPTGRCCYGDPYNPDCVDNITEDDCTTQHSGSWTEGLDCSTPCPILIDCSNPIQVTLPPPGLAWPYVDADQTTCGTGDSYDENTCLEEYYDNGEDIFYEITVTEDVTVNIDLTSNTTYTGMAIGILCPPGPGCLASSMSSGENEAIEALTLPAGTYYLMIDTWSAPDCIDNYTLTIDEYVEPTGACCVYPECVATNTQAECDAIENSIWYIGEDCATFECPNPEDIPTLSEWGMIILTLLLLSVGTVAVIRRRKAISAKGVARG